MSDVTPDDEVERQRIEHELAQELQISFLYVTTMQAYECTECAGLTLDTVAHLKWHKKLRESLTPSQ